MIAPRSATTLAGLAVLTLAVSYPAQAVARNPLVGVWRLIEIDEVDAGGKLTRHVDLKGSLIYTANGTVSVQVSYPDLAVNNDYVRSGYEASFGSYTFEAATRRVTHHIEAANVNALVGKDLSRTYRFVGRRLMIGPLNVAEHWSVIWERR
jgi:hypothetical protein